ncbi:hypothetical protein [Treponema sp. R80B11-R83G3]
MIQPLYFHDLLECLAGQFFDTNSACCVGKDFGINISSSAKEYFSVDIVSEELQNDLVVLGVLFDDSAYVPGRTGFTFTIYIDLSRFIDLVDKTLFQIILAHEICHFVFYYELFLKLGDNTGIRSNNDFIHAVSSKLIGAVTNERDNTSQTIFDEHNIANLLNNLRNFQSIHFSKGQETNINYQKFLDDFLQHLNIDELFL